jgi:hypothetical protein
MSNNRRVAIVALTEGKEVRAGGWVELTARPQRPVRVVGVMLEQRRERNALEHELYQAGLDAMETAKGKHRSERERLTEAARLLHVEAEQGRAWTTPEDFRVTGFYIGVSSVFLTSEPLSATLLTQLGRKEWPFEMATDVLQVGMDARLMLVNVGRGGRADLGEPPDPTPSRDIRGALLCEVVA